MTKKAIIHSLDEIPKTMTEAEEQAFWESHELGEEIAFEPIPEDDPEAPPARSRDKTRVTPIRFTEKDLERYKRMAKIKGVGYQTLIKQFASERLYEEEKREGLV